MNERSKIFSVTITPRGIVAYFAPGLACFSVGRTFIILSGYRQGQSESDLGPI